MILSDTLSAHLPENPTAVALGFFDGIHRGHTKVISAVVQAADQQGLTPCVFTFSSGKGSPKPVGDLIQTDEVKQYILERMGVQQIFRPPFEEFRDFTPEEFVRTVLADRFKARVVACGENFRFGKFAAGDAELLCRLGREYGIEVIVLPLEREKGEIISSTLIRKTLREGDIEAANRLLGHPFTLIAPVVHGRGLGRQWNYPTANQYFPDEQIIPQNGVYATIAVCDGKRYVGSTNVGKKPTVGGDTVLREPFLGDYEGDLYGKKLVVEFYHFVRGEKKFGSLEELRQAIEDSTRKSVELCEKYREIPLQTGTAVIQSIGN